MRTEWGPWHLPQVWESHGENKLSKIHTWERGSRTAAHGAYERTPLSLWEALLYSAEPWEVQDSPQRLRSSHGDASCTPDSTERGGKREWGLSSLRFIYLEIFSDTELLPYSFRSYGIANIEVYKYTNSKKPNVRSFPAELQVIIRVPVLIPKAQEGDFKAPVAGAERVSQIWVMWQLLSYPSPEAGSLFEFRVFNVCS